MRAIPDQDILNQNPLKGGCTMAQNRGAGAGRSKGEVPGKTRERRGAYRPPRLQKVGSLSDVRGRTGPNRDRYGGYYRIYS